MKYTRENLVGLEVVHNNKTTSYRIIRVIGNRIDTEAIHNNNTLDTQWASVEDVNRWVENGIWIVTKDTLITYEIF